MIDREVLCPSCAPAGSVGCRRCSDTGTLLESDLHDDETPTPLWGVLFDDAEDPNEEHVPCA